MNYGVTIEGFKKKRLIDIKTEIEESLKLGFGDNISLIPQSVFGQLVGVISERESLEWDNLENVYNSFYPSTAQGVALSELVLLNAIQRIEATQTTATVTITGTDGTIVTKGSIVKTSDTDKRFTIDNDVIINGITTVTVTAVNFGEIVAVAGTIETIDTPISGWETVTNNSDAKTGRNEETDPELRTRRESSVGVDAQNLTDSTYAQLANLEGVSDVIVIDNKTDAVDANGIPAHEFLCVIRGGVNSEIGAIIWSNTPQGIRSFGAVTEQVIDVQGNLQDVKFSRPVDKDIYFEIDITTDANFPLNGEDEIKANIVTFGNDNFNINDDVIQSRFFIPVNQTKGIIDIEIRLGFTTNPTGTANLPITSLEVSAYDTTRIVVNVT
ncbi:MAG: baseplate J/gp47 family protein [Campylobacterota bacterium]|nr:baseplate J/gp47 family protein [Campylobacterota bacterium]